MEHDFEVPGVTVETRESPAPTGERTDDFVVVIVDLNGVDQAGRNALSGYEFSFNADDLACRRRVQRLHFQAAQKALDGLHVAYR